MALESDSFNLRGAEQGRFPITTWGEYYIEIPEHGVKKEIAGRTNGVFGIRFANQTWDWKRIVQLPLYYGSSLESELDGLKVLIKHWGEIQIPDDIPSIAIALKCRGFYSEGREIQNVTVMLIWRDSVARMISLDWIEGPMEDCTTPEWFIEASSLLNLRDGMDRMRNAHKNLNWENPVHSLYVIPSCLGRGLKGSLSTTNYESWRSEWNYREYEELRADLISLLSSIERLFVSTRGDGNEQ
jgi:hypothetical protein